MRQPRPAVVAALTARYPESHEFTDRIWFLRTSETAQQISDAIFTATDSKNGVVVIRVAASYYGYAKSEVWDWLAGAFKEDSRG